MLLCYYIEHHQFCFEVIEPSTKEHNRDIGWHKTDCSQKFDRLKQFKITDFSQLDEKRADCKIVHSFGLSNL